MKKQIRFIVNPISGVGQKKILPNLIHSHLNHSIYLYDIVYTEYRGHAVELTKKFVSEEIDVVCIVGGDGSIREVASALIFGKTALAIISTGSGNGIARHLGLPLRIIPAIERINRFKTIQMDTFKVNEIVGVGFVGFGYDALIAQKFDKLKKRGLRSYVKLVMWEWRKYKGVSLQIGTQKYSNLFLCTVANTSQFGNDFYISPLSDATDGKLELVIVPKTNLFRTLQLLILSMRKKLHRSKHIKTITMQNMDFQMEENLFHIDGDPMKSRAKVVAVKIIPKSLKVIV